MVNRLTLRTGFATLILSFLVQTPCAGQGLSGDDGPKYGTEVRPILARCLACHGPDENARQAELRLDSFADATRDLGGYAAVVPGDPEKSELVLRISESDTDLVMPPTTHGESLSPQQIKILADWITAGAKYEQHWAYVAPVKTEPPLVAGDSWSSNEIDRFVLNAMRAQGLDPNPAADRAALLRRASIDLTGLPPKPEDVQRFVDDPSSDPWSRAIDRLLADPAFGERWASVWLDLARYADSQGYSSDELRTIWPYRDYVIRSLNANKPFDQFTIEQLAGDLLENPSQDSLVATAFHRNTLTNTEGGTDDEEFRNVAVVDRVNTTFAVWMGTTIACAQCHTHKYDPITQEEYFRFFDIFNQTTDNDQPNDSPLMEIYGDEELAQIAELDRQIRLLQTEYQDGTGAGAGTEHSLTDWLVAQSAGSPGFLPVPMARFVRIDLPGEAQILSLAEVEVLVDGQNIAASGTATQSSVDYSGPAELAIDGNTEGDFEKGKSVTHSANEANPWWQLDLQKPQSIDQIRIWNRTGGELPARLNGFVLSLLDESGQAVWQRRFEKAPETELMIPVRTIPEAVARGLEVLVAERDEVTNKLISDFARQAYDATSPVALELVSLQTKRSSVRPVSTVPVLREVRPGKRRETHIQIRGSFLNKADLVTAGTPSAFHSLPDGSPVDRLAAAKWLVDRNNPLTARVLVNRFWEQLFGTGLVETSEEFGSQGEYPSHPELLDWLAVELMESGWDCNHLLRMMVCHRLMHKAVW